MYSTYLSVLWYLETFGFLGGVRRFMHQAKAAPPSCSQVSAIIGQFQVL